MKRLISGIVIIGIALLVGTVGFPAIIMSVIIYNKPIADGIMPGKLDFTVTQTGTLNINQRYLCMYNGKSYNLPKALPDGWTVSLKRLDDGVTIPLTNSFSIASHPARKNSFVNIARFNATPGQYQLEVKGKGDPRPFVIAPPVAGKVIFTFIVTLVIFSVGMLLGTSLVFRSVMRHLQHRRLS